MKSPLIIILELDPWLSKQLRDLANECRWLIQTTRTVEGVLSLVRSRRPAVLIVQIELGEDKPEPLKLVAEVHRSVPETPVVVVSDVKFPDAERSAWTAALMDLGATYVLFPPLTKPVLEDMISGLMTSAIRTVMGSVVPPPVHHRGEIIDLATGAAEE